MSAFNTVRGHAVCPRCKVRTPVVVQFKYGNTWQFKYEIGDVLRWGGNQIGEPGRKRVVLDGIADGPCPLCGSDQEWNLYIFVERDRLIATETAAGLYDFGSVGQTFVVLEE